MNSVEGCVCGALPDFVFCYLIIPVQQISSGIHHHGSFFGLVSNILNVKSNAQKRKSTVINVPSYCCSSCNCCSSIS